MIPHIPLPSSHSSAEPFTYLTSQQTGGNAQAEKDADKDTEGKLKDIKKLGDKEGKKVVEDLLKAVTDVKPIVPDRVEQPVS